MLAAHLRRLEKPVRYALDPAHEQAIRNYLAIASRAQNVSAMHAAPNTQRILGDAAPLGNELHQTMMQQHDPASLAGLIDLLSDQGAVPWTGTGTTPNHSLLLRTLLHMNRMISGYGGRDENNKLLGAGAHPAVLRGYGDEGLNEYASAVRKGHGLQTIPPWGAALSPLLALVRASKHPVLQGHLEALDTATSTLDTGNPLGAVGLHDTLTAPDVAGIMHGQGPQAYNHYLTGRRVANRALELAHPALWHYGEHGEFPQ